VIAALVAVPCSERWCNSRSFRILCCFVIFAIEILGMNRCGNRFSRRNQRTTDEKRSGTLKDGRNNRCISFLGVKEALL